MSSVKLARPKSSFFGRDCLTLLDYTTEEILHIIHEGMEMKKIRFSRCSQAKSWR